MKQNKFGLIEVQSVAWTRNGRLIHAGVHKVRKITMRTARRLQGEWKAWRNAYIAESIRKDKNARFPLMEEMKCATFILHPIDNPSEAKSFFL